MKTPIDRALRELEDSNDRAVAIVAATLLENTLEEAIVSRLLPMSKAHRAALFTSDSSYTFASKIDLGLSLGLYGQRVKAELHRIKKIRNEFAHNIERDFMHEIVIKNCMAISDYSEMEPLDPESLKDTPETLRPYIEGREWRWRYLFAVMHINLGLTKERHIAWRPTTPTFLAD